MIEYRLNIGDVATSSKWANYTCFGLGSCIGLFIQDRITGVSGGAHILLPELESCPSENFKYYNVISAIDEIIGRLKFQGNPLTGLRAKITGGANVLGVNSKTGELNSASVIKHLTAHKIFIAGVDIGGNYCRTATYESKTGLLTVKIPQINICKTL